MEIAVLIPCYNEALSIRQVILDFQKFLPEAKIYIYDNNSTDQTAEIAKSAGAIVRFETKQGKGHVVYRMFGDIEADYYIMVDGDGTYDISMAPQMINILISQCCDMVNGKRIESDAENYRKGHRFGNWMLTGIVAAIFSAQFSDMLSGYKAFSKKFVKSFPSLSRGFEIETQITIHALEMNLPVREIETKYINRLEGSESKLSTYKDGIKILYAIGLLFIREKPFVFFGAIAGVLAAVMLILFIPIYNAYLLTGLVPKFPTLILIGALGISSLICLVTGLISESITMVRKELKRLTYLSIKQQ
jgi:glycosyltransferase involved in cell wall biosynthesis